MLVWFLKPGGVLLVFDIQDPSEACSQLPTSSTTKINDHVIPEKFHHMVPHTHGFKSDTIRKVFEGAGLTSFFFDTATKARKTENSCDTDPEFGYWQDVTFFIAKGVKPSTGSV